MVGSAALRRAVYSLTKVWYLDLKYRLTVSHLPTIITPPRGIPCWWWVDYSSLLRVVLLTCERVALIRLNPTAILNSDEQSAQAAKERAQRGLTSSHCARIQSSDILYASLHLELRSSAIGLHVSCDSSGFDGRMMTNIFQYLSLKRDEEQWSDFQFFSSLHVQDHLKSPWETTSAICRDPDPGDLSILLLAAFLFSSIW